MQKRAMDPRQRESQRVEFLGGTIRRRLGQVNRVEKRATEVVARAHTGRLCKCYAISDKWRDRERNRDEEKRRPLARAIAGVYLLLR